MAKLLYIDSSALLRRVFDAPGRAVIERTAARYVRDRGTLVSSRLLWLEATRVGIRESLLGNPVNEIIAANLDAVTQLPLTEEVWAGAAAMTQHIKTLDSLHVATCQLVGADLLTFDSGMRAVAKAVGLRLAA